MTARSAWECYCMSYFANEDEESKRILEIFDEAMIAHGNRFDYDDIGLSKHDQNRTEDKALGMKLLELGFERGKNGNWILSDDILQSYSEIKSTVRREFHRTVRRKKEMELRKLIHDILNSTGKDPQLEALSNEFSRSIMLFTAAYSGSVSTHPFFAGFNKLLSSQLGSKNLWTWSVDSAVFIEGGGAFESVGSKADGREINSFMLDSLSLLSQVLQCLCNFDEESSTDLGCITWQTKSHLSDHNIKQILRYLPDLNKLQALPSGSFRQGDVVRSVVEPEISYFLLEICRSWCTVS